MLLYDLINVEYKDFVPMAWQYFNQAEQKGPTHVGNHHFDLPKDIEFQRTYPHLYNHNGEAEDTGLAAREKSGFDQHRFAQDSDFINQVKEYFGLDFIYCAVNNLKPGMLTAVHFDLNRSALLKYTPEQYQKKIKAEDKHRYIVFLEDQKPGQHFEVGNEYVKWKAGDIISFPWYMPHSTANCGEVDRYFLNVAGFVNPDKL